MIEKDKEKRALKAIHRLIGMGRALGYRDAPSYLIARFFDDIECLPFYMWSDIDQTADFEKALAIICERFNCKWISVWYHDPTENIPLRQY
ncbi:MAG TPA: hypothetical protein VF008_02200 [Niastella sp.]